MINQIKDANPIIILQNQIALLKLKAKNCLQISEGGGIFNITPELIAHAQVYITRYTPPWIAGSVEVYNPAVEAIFMDKNDNPIKIVDVKKFLDKLLEQEQEVMNDYYIEFEKLKKRKSAVEWCNE